MSADAYIDKTFFIQAGIFVASFGVLRGLVFGPYLDLLRARQEKTTQLKEHAELQKVEAESLKEQYESLMRSERRKLQTWLDDERRKISDEERRVIQRARDTSNESMKAFRDKLIVEAGETRKSLIPKISDFASQLASTILGKKVVVSSKVQPISRKEASLS